MLGVIKDRDVHVLTCENSVLRRLKEYFEELMNKDQFFPQVSCLSVR